MNTELGNNYLNNIVNIYDSDNGLYQVFPSFTVKTMISLSPEFFTYTSFLDYAQKSGSKAFYSREDMNNSLSEYMPFYLSDFIDFDNNFCDFENDIFSQFIELVKIQENCNHERFDKLLNDTCFAENICCTNIFTINTFGSLDNIYSINKVPLYVTGFPSINGGQSIVVPDFCFSIPKQATNKEKAWNFIKYFFSDEYQNKFCEIKNPGFPVKKSAYEKLLNNTTPTENTAKTDSIINSINQAPVYSSEINEIVSDELYHYFYENTSKDEVIKNIKEKVKRYLFES